MHERRCLSARAVCHTMLQRRGCGSSRWYRLRNARVASPRRIAERAIPVTDRTEAACVGCGAPPYSRAMYNGRVNRYGL